MHFPGTRIPIRQYSLKELYDNRSPNFLHHDERVARLRDPQIIKAFASTLILRTPSSKFGTNHIYWHQYLLFEDFVQIARDREIPLRDAVRYAIEDGDVHIFCDCPAHLFYGYKYIATQLGYTYGGYREGRAPVVNNPGLLGTGCKHLSNVTLWLRDNIDVVLEWFAVYYQSVVSTDSDSAEDIVSVSDVAEPDVVAETHVEPVEGGDGDGEVIVTDVFAVGDSVMDDEPEALSDSPSDGSSDSPSDGSPDNEPPDLPPSDTGYDFDVAGVFDGLGDYLDSYPDVGDSLPEGLSDGESSGADVSDDVVDDEEDAR